MNDIHNVKDVISTLCAMPGISGYETPAAMKIKELWNPYADEVVISKAGNVYAHKKADTPVAPENNRKVLFAVHMDALGMMVSEFHGEFLRFATIGGFDPRILPGQFVTIHGKAGDVRGLVVQPTANITQGGYGTNPVPLSELFIDTGYTAEELPKHVAIGDIISFANKPVCMEDDTISAHSLDNRASVAAATFCLRALQSVKHSWDVYAAATVQEEISLLGGITAPYEIEPDLAVAIDVTFAKGPGSSGWETQELASGAALGYGMNVHPALYHMCKDICETEHIPYTTEFYPRMSGTDAIGIQISRQGIPTMVISIPLRYMHTANEIISLKDVQSVGQLLTSFVQSLDADTMNKITWEDNDD